VEGTSSGRSDVKDTSKFTFCSYLHFHFIFTPPPSSLTMRSLLGAVLLLPLAAQALHFYFESNEKRCFMEELPSDTIVEGGSGDFP
jgi:hypothetical protein